MPLISLLSSSIDQCQSIEFSPMTFTDEIVVHCHCEENRYLCLNLCELRSIVQLCYSLLFSSLDHPSRLDEITRVLLCYVSECLTSWNIRRRLILSRTIDVHNELQFTLKLLHLRPKSEQIFRYRRWLIKQIDRKEISIDNELNLCERTAEKHPINYAAWLFRRWFVEDFHLDLHDELERNLRWLKTNLSDSSGFSYRIFLLSKCDKIRLDDEFRTNEEMLKFYLDRESLWIFRRNLTLLALNLFHLDRTNFLNNETKFIENFKENRCAEKYRQFLEKMK